MRFVVCAILAVLVTACGGSPVREQYCGTDSFYSISETRDRQYRLDLKIGLVQPGICRGLEWRERLRNLTVKVGSVDEAHRIIDRERARAKDELVLSR